MRHVLGDLFVEEEADGTEIQIIEATLLTYHLIDAKQEEVAFTLSENEAAKLEVL